MATRGGSAFGARVRRTRTVALILAAAAVCLLALADPGALPINRITCPFLWLTGLPCAFCGLTRALHHLFRCEWSIAWYLNPLAFPVALVAIGLFARTLVERLTDKAARPLPRLSRAWFVVLAGLVLLHWGMHIRSAIITPKPELLRPPASQQIDRDP